MKHSASTKYIFSSTQKRQVECSFDGGYITSEGGAVLLQQIEDKYGIISQISQCFTDHRNQNQIEHSVDELLRQRIFGIALGYEDVNDHDELRNDPLLAMVVGKTDPTGSDRSRERDKGKPLAGKSTLNRLELAVPSDAVDDRYKKIAYEGCALDQVFVNLFMNSYEQEPEEIILDLDATNDPLFGNQEGKHFHGYYDQYCYLPLYIFCGNHLLLARLRTSDCDAAAGSVDELRKIVTQIRTQWENVRIIIRGDSGFCREDIMSYCERNDLLYILGLPKNSRLFEEISEEIWDARDEYYETGKPCRVFRDFHYKTLKSWSKERRVIGKAEFLDKGYNPRFIVTSLDPEYEGQYLYEQMYCRRGDMENRIKEQQLALFADRTSSNTMRANQLRLYFSSIAYCFFEILRRVGLAETKMVKSQCTTLRLKMLKIGAFVKLTTRRFIISLASGYPYEHYFAHAYHKLK